MSLYTVKLQVEAKNRTEALREIGYRLVTHIDLGEWSIEEHGVKILEINLEDKNNE